MKHISITITETPPCEYESLEDLKRAAERAKDSASRARREHPEDHDWSRAIQRQRSTLPQTDGKGEAR